MGKHYIVGRGRCPRCGAEGTVILRVDGSRPYVYVRHGRVWHYIGTLDRVNLEHIITNRTSPEVNVRHNSTAYNKAVIITMLAIVMVVASMAIITKYLGLSNASMNVGYNDDLGNTVKQTVIGYANPDLSYEFMINNHSEINICPLINDLD